MWWMAGGKNGESNNEALEWIPLRHLKGISSVEHARIVSVPLLFLFDWFWAGCLLCNHVSVIGGKNQGFLPAPASLVLVCLAASENIVVVCICQCGFGLGAWAQQALARLTCIQSRSSSGVKLMCGKYIRAWGWKDLMSCLGFSRSTEGLPCQSRRLAFRPSHLEGNLDFFNAQACLAPKAYSSLWLGLIRCHVPLDSRSLFSIAFGHVSLSALLPGWQHCELPAARSRFWRKEGIKKYVMDFVLSIENTFSYENKINGNLSHSLLWHGKKLLMRTDRYWKQPRDWFKCLNVSRYINNVILSYHGLDICCLQIGKIPNTACLKISLFKRHLPRSGVLGNKFSYNQRGFFFY